MARSKSSRRWLAEHHNDPYTRQARAEGYRARAAYKLIELDRKDGLLRPGQCVVDLGAAPGSWSQYAAERVGDGGRVVATDRLRLDPIAGVTFLEGDFRDEAMLARLLEAVGPGGSDLVMSDMAPNITGADAVDQPASMALAELAHELALRILKPGGAFVTKMFQGEGSDAFTGGLKSDFERVRIRKPRASRDRSREVYVVATGRKL